MFLFNCDNRCRCTAVAVIVGAIAGVVAAFLQITAVITVTPVFLLVALGAAALLLGLLVAVSAAFRNCERCSSLCRIVNTLLVGILGTILFAVILLATGIVATSILSAILVGLVVFFGVLTLVDTACLVRCLFSCGS